MNHIFRSSWLIQSCSLWTRVISYHRYMYNSLLRRWSEGQDYWFSHKAWFKIWITLSRNETQYYSSKLTLYLYIGQIQLNPRVHSTFPHKRYVYNYAHKSCAQKWAVICLQSPKVYMNQALPKNILLLLPHLPFRRAAMC